MLITMELQRNCYYNQFLQNGDDFFKWLHFCIRGKIRLKYRHTESRTHNAPPRRHNSFVAYLGPVTASKHKNQLYCSILHTAEAHITTFQCSNDIGLLKLQWKGFANLKQQPRTDRQSNFYTGIHAANYAAGHSMCFNMIFTLLATAILCRLGAEFHTILRHLTER